MDLQLIGKNAIVTGAGRGIGRAIARQLALEGCDIAMCARSEGGEGAPGVDADAMSGTRILIGAPRRFNSGGKALLYRGRALP